MIEVHRGVLVIWKPHLKSNFCRKGAWFDVTDVNAGFLCWTTGDADTHTLGTYKAEENLLLLDLLPSEGCQACNAAFFLLSSTERKKKRKKIA